MKKYGKCLAILAVLVMAALAPAVSDACVVTDWLFATSDLMCSPTYAQQQEAGAMVTALIAAKVTGVDAEIIKSALLVLKNGGCFLIAQLKDAFAMVDAANASVIQAQLKRLPGMAPPTLPEYPALRRLVQ